MNIALDIDDTITKIPPFFCLLARSIRRAGGKVYVLTTRSDEEFVRKHTREELASYGLEYDGLFIIPNSGSRGQLPCPHTDLDWYQKYLWQKVKLCLDRDVHIVFDDDAKVVGLFKRFAPGIQVFHVL